MDFLRGESNPISSGLPFNRKSVRTIGGMEDPATHLSGWKAVAPLNPPKNISPLGLLKHVHQPVRSSPGRPSALEQLVKVLFAGSSRDIPLFVLIHKLPRSSSRMQSIALPAKPS